MAAILVTDGEQRAALAVVRSLGRAGHTVTVCSPRPRPLAGASRYAAATALVPDPLADPEGFAGVVARLVRTHRADLLIPVADPSVAALLPVRERFRPAVIPFPDWPAYARISDKACLLGEAAALGIAVPESVVVHRPDALNGVTTGKVRFPVAIKPTRSLAGASGPRRVPVRFAREPGELAAHLAVTPPAAYPLLVQQRIVGPGAGVFLLVWGGEPLAVFGHRRLRERPPSGGVSVLCESVAPDPALVESSRALLARFDWQGVAMVEYKLEAASGTPYLMEVNGRFWGSLQLATDAGVDFPARLADAALGRPRPPLREYRVGLRSRWWWGSVDHVIARLRNGHRRDPSASGNGSRVRALSDLARLLGPGARSDVLKPYDPLPFLRETVAWISALDVKRNVVNGGTRIARRP